MTDKQRPSPEGLHAQKMREMNKVTFWCSGCQREFKYVHDGEGNFKRWVTCECGQDRPVVETNLGTTL